MTLIADIKRADWTDPGQWAHAGGYVMCRVLHGKNCQHIGNLGTFSERWPEIAYVYLAGVLAATFWAGRMSAKVVRK